MPTREAQTRAKKKYAQTPKGKEVLMKAHRKRADTEEYRAYQREKQREYRRRRKLEASGGQAIETPIKREDAVAAEEFLRLPQIKVAAEVKAAVRSLPDTSAWLRRVIVEAAERELLQPDQGSGNRGAA